MKCGLPAVVSLALLGCGAAEAGQIVNTTFLTSHTVDVHRSGSGFDIHFVGLFLVPAVPSGLQIQNVDRAMDYDFGITSWAGTVPGNSYFAGFEATAGWGLSPGVGNIERYGTANDPDGPTWQFAISHKGGYSGGPADVEFSADGPYASNGYVPYYLRIDLYAAPLIGVPVAVDPSYLIYFGGIRLVTTADVVGPSSGGNGNLASGPSSGLVWYVASAGSGDAIPAALQTQLPPYIPSTISAVPEPVSMELMFAGLAGLWLRRRRRN